MSFDLRSRKRTGSSNNAPQKILYIIFKLESLTFKNLDLFQFFCDIVKNHIKTGQNLTETVPKSVCHLLK